MGTDDLRATRVRRSAEQGGSFYSVLKRDLDLLVSFFLLLVLSPVLWLTAVALYLRWPNTVLDRTPRLGLNKAPFTQYCFATRIRYLRPLPLLYNILRGDMSFVGPRAVEPGELLATEPGGVVRFRVRPGLIGLSWIRKRANIDYDGEAAADAEYVDGFSFRRDTGIVLRALPGIVGCLLPGAERAVAARTERRTEILGVPVDNLTMQGAIDSILALLRGSGPQQVAFVNADCVNIACNRHDYATVLQRSRLVFADGIGLQVAGRMLGRPLRQNVNGTDMFPRLCAALENTGHGVYLLGAQPGVAELVREWIQTHYPGVIVSGCHQGYLSPEDDAAVVREVAESKAAILLVAMGAPKQDLWIAEHLDDLGVKAAIGVGGLFDFYSGRLPRAPQWVREMGMEWFYRFCQEPSRLFRRYFVGNGVFLARVLRERLRPGSAKAGTGSAEGFKAPEAEAPALRELERAAGAVDMTARLPH